MLSVVVSQCQNWRRLHNIQNIQIRPLYYMIIQNMRHLPTLGFPNVKAHLPVSAPSPLLPSQQNMQPLGTKCFWFISSALLQQTCRQCSTMFETESAIIRVGAFFFQKVPASVFTLTIYNQVVQFAKPLKQQGIFMRKSCQKSFF